MNADWNSPKSLRAWVDGNIERASKPRKDHNFWRPVLTSAEADKAREIAKAVLDDGGLRGDVGTMWKKHFGERVHAFDDLYL